MTLIAAQWRLIKTSPTPRAPPTNARHWAAPRTPRRGHRRRGDVNPAGSSRPATGPAPPLEGEPRQSTGTPLPSTRRPARSPERAVPEAAIGRRRRHTAARPASPLGLARQRLAGGRGRRRDLPRARPPVGWRRRPSGSPPPPAAAPPARAAEVSSGARRRRRPPRAAEDGACGRARYTHARTARRPSMLRVTRAPRGPPAARAGGSGVRAAAAARGAWRWQPLIAHTHAPRRRGNGGEGRLEGGETGTATMTAGCTQLPASFAMRGAGAPPSARPAGNNRRGAAGSTAPAPPARPRQPSHRLLPPLPLPCQTRSVARHLPSASVCKHVQQPPMQRGKKKKSAQPSDKPPALREGRERG